MTNWMTAAGLALIAGGLATLISFRSMLFGGGERRARRRSDRALEAPRRRPALPAAPIPEPAEPEDLVGAGSRRARRGRRRALATASREQEIPSLSLGSEEDDRGGLASIGFADEEDPIDAYADSCVDAEEDEPAVEEEELAPAPRRSDRYGDRVEGWVRPEYHDQPDEPRPGEYWTPIPVDLAGDAEPSAKGYGWPRPVERLPAVPDYEPATGFDLIPVVSEPTEVVPAWPMNDDRPGRIRLPRSWATRNDKPARNEKPDKPPATERRRPRPRPRPEPPADRNTTVYVSRHAADPPPPPPPPRQGR
ncbi:hypothetical protein ACQPZX_45755 [Actinoplanes sp. CA-142083]|uniref:hypothetical protein n=1 Tax=Actinoplanes sp. CA-142083 TaxID=3239903 RepID=UPI003D92B926